MAEEIQKPATEEVVVVEKPTAEKEALVPEPEPEPEKVEKVEKVEKFEEVVEEVQKEKVEEEVKIVQSVSFKEESYVVGELPEAQRKAFEELKQLVQQALNKHEFTGPPVPPKEEKKEEEKKEEEKKEEEKKEEEVPPASSSAAEKPPKAEEKPEEAPVEAKEEQPAKEEPKEKEVAPEVVEPKAEEPPKEEPKDKEVAPEVVAPKEEEKVPPPPPTEAVAEEVVEKATATDETAESIKETIVVEVPPPPPTTSTEPEAPPAETKAVEEAEAKVEEAEVPAPPPPPPEEVSIWGIPLLQDERSDVILLKFLRARDFKVKDALTMLKNTVRWRKEFGIDALLEEDFGNDWDKVVFTHGYDKEGHPVCYNVFSEFQNKELYQKSFSTEEKRQKFLKWRVQFLERSIRTLDFSPTGISAFVQVNDLRNSFGISKRELWQVTKQAVQLFQDNYPEFLAKQIVINVPWWYLAYNMMISPFLTQRTKSKFVLAGPAKSAETLFRYISPEQVPVQYGGLKREEEQDFTIADPVSEVAIKPASKHTIEFPVAEGYQLAWEVRVVGWEVSHGAEFVPSTEGSYTVIVQKTRKIAAADETVITNSFKASEEGRVVLTFDNQTSKKKKLLYRSKSKSSSD